MAMDGDLTVRPLTGTEAVAFAEMLLSGVPVAEAVPYFWDRSVTEAELLACEGAWPQQTAVRAAMQVMTGGEPWHKMDEPVRLEVSLKKHYSELAYFLWTTNYAECDGGAKVKADTCRQALEAKVAGMAGKESPLARFYHDLLTRYEAEPAKVQ
jgi:hypothetical protein